MIRRRVLFASMAVTALSPGRAWTQQPARMPRIGALFLGNPEPAWQMIRNGMRALGYVEGKTVRLELRSAEGQIDRLPGLAAELVRLPVDLIVALQTPAVQAAKQATRDLPIIMAGVGDPVGTGLIDSLAHPGGNITGTTTLALSAKGLELIREILPEAKRVAVLGNAGDPFTPTLLDNIGRGASALGIGIQSLMVRDAADYDAAFASMLNERADAVIVQPSLPRTRAIELAQKHRLLSFSGQRAFTDEGGLVSRQQLVQRLLALNDPARPWIVRPGPEADLLVEWKYADASWWGVLGKAGMKRAYRLRLYFDEARHQCGALDEFGQIDWSAGLLSAPRVHFSHSFFRGIQLVKMERGVAYGFKTPTGSGAGKVLAYTFDIAEVK